MGVTCTFPSHVVVSQVISEVISRIGLDRWALFHPGEGTGADTRTNRTAR